MRKAFSAISLALIVGWLGGQAAQVHAQDKVDGETTRQLKSQDTVPPATGRNLPEQNAAQEPSSKVQNLSRDENVFVNGALSVAGAPTDVDTVPAKYSAQNAADDKISIAGYRLKYLKPEQRAEIARALGSAAPKSVPEQETLAVVGAEIPAPFSLQDLVPIPASVTGQFPGLTGFTFVRAGTKILIVDPENNIVIGVLDA